MQSSCVARRWVETEPLSGRLIHGGNPVLHWMASNVALEIDASENWKPSKKKSRERIDGIVALIMGLERATCYQPVTGSLFMYSGMEMG